MKVVVGFEWVDGLVIFLGEKEEFECWVEIGVLRRMVDVFFVILCYDCWVDV